MMDREGCKFIIVRHGDTYANRVFRPDGTEYKIFPDPEGNKKGLTNKCRDQAENLRPRLFQYLGDNQLVVSSSLPRAIETAKILAGDNSVTTTPLARETEYGWFGGRYVNLPDYQRRILKVLIEQFAAFAMYDQYAMNNNLVVTKDGEEKEWDFSHCSALVFPMKHITEEVRFGRDIYLDSQSLYLLRNNNFQTYLDFNKDLGITPALAAASRI